MLTVRGRFVAILLAVGLSTSSCWLAAPSDWAYALGVAKIGDTYHVIAPLCDDESLESVEVYDNTAAGKAALPMDDTTYTYWLAEFATAAAAQQGRVAIGEDKAFERVPIRAGSNAAFPTEVMGISIWVRWADSTKIVGYAVALEEVPSYPAGADPATVKYTIDDDEREARLLSPAEIDTTYKRCARENAGVPAVRTSQEAFPRSRSVALRSFCQKAVCGLSP